MGALERIRAQYDRLSGRRAELAWPVGAGAVPLGDDHLGHDSSQFAPEEYGDYIATSNEIYSAASLRARLMSGLTLGCFNGRGSKKKAVEAGPVVDLFTRVNPFWTLRRLLRMDELAMCLWGQSCWAIHKDRGRPTEIWWLKPSRVRPLPDENNYLRGFIYEPITGHPPITFDADEVVWFRYPNPIDEFAPLSPLAAARLAADTGKAMMQANKQLFDNGLAAAGIVMPKADKVTFGKEQALELEQFFDRRLRGVDRQHRWGVLRYEAQLHNLNVTPRDAEFVTGLNLTLRQVGNAYGIPTPLLNDMEHATLSNAREYQQILWAHALVPDADLRAAEIEEQLLPMFGARVGQMRVDHVEWDYSQVPALQEAATEVWDRERGQLEVGAITINEWRQTHGLPPVEWGDVWWGPVNKSAVTDADSTPQGDTAPAAVPPAGGEDQDDEDETPTEQAAPRFTHWDARRFLATAGLNGGNPTWS